MNSGLSDSDIPMRRPHCQWVELDGEAVVYDASTGHLHRLNSSATAVWSACEGSTTVGELVCAMRDAHEGSAATIDHDVREVVVRLIDAGLLEIRHD